MASPDASQGVFSLDLINADDKMADDFGKLWMERDIHKSLQTVLVNHYNDS